MKERKSGGNTYISWEDKQIKEQNKEQRYLFPDESSHLIFQVCSPLKLLELTLSCFWVESVVCEEKKNYWIFELFVL